MFSLLDQVQHFLDLQLRLLHAPQSLTLSKMDSAIQPQINHLGTWANGRRTNEATENLDKQSSSFDDIRQTSAQCLASEIGRAATKLHGRVIHTPTIRLPWLDSQDLKVWAKLECQQHTGSFKYRGALYAMEQSSAQTIVTASAGNHALAVCAAAQVLGKKSHIIAPVGVSEIKAKRIFANADRVSFFGNDLAEATRQAMKQVTATTSSYYVSPYADPTVAAGAGTMMPEAHADAGPFDYVVVPLGGGGLASAVAAWCSENTPRTQVICAHPNVFGRSFDNDMPLSAQLHRPTEASYCDGLAVQAVQQTPLATILDTLVSQVIQVSENDIAIAIAQAVRSQSLLLEGSAAITIAALPQLATAASGHVLLLLTGSNIAANSVARALVTHVPDTTYRRDMGLRNVINPAERYGALSDLTENRNHFQPTHVSSEEPRSIFAALSNRLLVSLEGTAGRVEQCNLLSTQLDLRIDSWSQSVVSTLLSQIRTLALEFAGHVADEAVPLWSLEERYRIVLQLLSAASSMFERASPAYDQALTQWFGDTASQNSNMVNYDRYGATSLRGTELMLLQALRPSENTSAPISLLLASSGMAAFQILLHYLLQHLRPGQNVVVPPYIYFECSEQIKSLASSGMFCLHEAPSFDAASLIRTTEQCDARVLFVDPIANMAGLPTTDIRDFARVVSHRPGWGSRIVIVDGTMVSGGLPIFDWFVGPHAPRVLLSESASKYIQFGLDLQMAGLVVFPRELDEDMRKIRRNLGSIMYSRGLSLFVPFDFSMHQARLSMLSQNAESLYLALRPAIATVAIVGYPINWREFGWRHGGSLVTIEFRNQGLNNREGLDACIELVLSKARTLLLPLTKGVSFGFSTSRISASSSMAENTDPFLRLSVGSEKHHVRLLESAITLSVSAYVEQFSSKL